MTPRFSPGVRRGAPPPAWAGGAFMTTELQTERIHIVRVPGERGGEQVITATRTGAVFIARLLQAGEVSRAPMVRPLGARQRWAWSRPTVRSGGAEKA
jgi:hypothetical protein